MLCRCRLKFVLGAWSTGLSIPCDAATQIVSREGKQKCTSVCSVPLRRVVTKRTVFRGEKLCVVPESHVLDGANAVNILQSAAAKGHMHDYNLLKRCLAGIASEPCLLTTRDALLAMLALHVLRHKSLQHPLSAWAMSLPSRVPPTGLLALLQETASNSFRPLERRMRVGDHTKAIPSTGNLDTQSAYVDLVLEAAERRGIGNVREPQTEVVASTALMTAFYRGERHPLTQRQHEATSAKNRHARSALRRQLCQLEEGLHESAFKPLLDCISDGVTKQAPNVQDDDVEINSVTLEQLRWSHFMVRSRAVNLHCGHPRGSRMQLPRVAVVPYLDMLNHSALGANVAYQYQPGAGVIITASRSIKAGEELVLDYGNFAQRGCLFNDTIRCNNVGTMDGTDGMRLIEMRQASEWDTYTNGYSEEDQLEEAPFGYGVEYQGSKCDDYEKQMRLEAVWLWRFGFARSEEEKSYLASRLWSKGLRRRIAQLTDIRRRGRPGEFVIGVPEGLQHLREQREQLEREQFGGAKVFPPQNA